MLISPPVSQDTWVVRLSPGGCPDRVFPLPAGEERAVTLGSAAVADLRVLASGVAPIHCSLQRRGQHLLLLLEAPNHFLSVDGVKVLQCVLSDRCTLRVGSMLVHVTLFRSNVVADVLGTCGTEIISREWLDPRLRDYRQDEDTDEFDPRELAELIGENSDTLPTSSAEQGSVRSARAALQLHAETLPLGTPREDVSDAACVPSTAPAERSTLHGLGPLGPVHSDGIGGSPSAGTLVRLQPSAPVMGVHRWPARPEAATATPRARRPRPIGRIQGHRRALQHQLPGALGFVGRLGAFARARPYLAAVLALGAAALLVLALLAAEEGVRSWFAYGIDRVPRGHR